MEEVTKVLQSASNFKETNDCAVRALALALQIDYAEAHKFFKNRGRKDRHGTPTYTILRKTKTIKGRKLSLKEFKHDITIPKFLKKYPVGNFLCVRRGHAFAVINGELFNQNLNHSRIKYFWKVTNIPVAEPEVIEAEKPQSVNLTELNEFFF